MPKHLLVTNDFPPKVGGIQNYLWELWRRMDPEEAHVYCTPHGGAAAFDAVQEFEVERSPEPVLLPYPWLARRVRDHADRVGADLILLDPAVPLGLIGPSLGRKYGVILHGAEVTIPGRLPAMSSALRRVLRGASLVVAAGQYALDEAERCAQRSLPAVVVPPGVDADRFRPASPGEQLQIRARFGVEPRQRLVSCVTRLVPRKGMQTLVAAVDQLSERQPELAVIIGGEGRDRSPVQKMVDDLRAPVRLLGSCSDADVVALYQASDVMAMPCNQRWWGLEQEGFGIAFLEAAATGTPQLAGRSGGAAEAVDHGVSGLVVGSPEDPDHVADALDLLLSDGGKLAAMGIASRNRAVALFGYPRLAARLEAAIAETIARGHV